MFNYQVFKDCCEKKQMKPISFEFTQLYPKISNRTTCLFSKGDADVTDARNDGRFPILQEIFKLYE